MVFEHFDLVACPKFNDNDDVRNFYFKKRKKSPMQSLNIKSTRHIVKVCA